MEEILDPRLRRLDLQTGTLPAKDQLDQPGEQRRAWRDIMAVFMVSAGVH